MNKQDFINLVKDPTNISPEQMKELEKIVAGFPYCQSAHILIAKYSSDTGTMLADQKLKKAAVYTLDRKNLKNLLHKKTTEKEIKDVVIDSPKTIETESEEESIPPTLAEEKTILAEKNDQPSIGIDEPVQGEQLEENVSENLAEEKPLAQEENNNTSAGIDLPVQGEQEEVIFQEKILEEKPVAEIKEEIAEAKNTYSSHDDILLELEKNLAKLRELKNLTTKAIEKTDKLKAHPAEEKVKAEEQKEVKSETIISEPVIENINTEETVAIEEEFAAEKIPEPEIKVEPEKVSPPPLENILEATYATPLTNPVRTEDVITEKTYAETERTDLLLDYLSYLDSERNQYKRNKKKEEDIINKFIKEDPSIPKLSAADLPKEIEDLSTKSTTVNKGLVSENYAKILGLQGKREKAIDIYNELILKNPEKKAYFEAQIEKLKK